MTKLAVRAATFAPDTYDAETNTIEVVLSTGAAVQRAGYVEKLPVANADLRGIKGAPVLDAHNQGSVRAILGSIQRAWKAGDELRALLKLSTAPGDADVVHKVANGDIRNLSIGYRVSKWADSTDSKGNRIRTAVAWSIHEASFVPIGADAGAVTRSSPMKKKLAGANPAPVDDVEETTPENENTVAQTRAQVRDIIKRAGGTAEQADELIDQDATVEQARAAAYDIMTARSNTAPRVRIINPGQSPEQTRDARADALFARASGAKPTDAARPFMSYRIMDHLRDMLEERGERVRGVSDYDLLTRALGTSDLPNLLTGVGARTLESKYQVAQSPLVALARKTSLTDFRENARLRAGEFGSLEPLSEHGEIKHASRTDSKNTVQLATFARRIDYTGKSIINDDLSALTDAAEQFGIAAAARDAEELVAVLNANPQMDDNQNLFSAAHDNTVAFDRIDVNSLSRIRLAMRSIVGLDGVTRLNIAPKYLVVSANMETEAEQFLAEYQPQSSDETNPFQSKLTLMVEPRLGEWEWFVFADPALAPVLELAHLSGREGPQVESQQAWDTWGVSFRCIHHVGAAAIGWRGAYRVESGEDSNSMGG